MTSQRSIGARATAAALVLILASGCGASTRLHPVGRPGDLHLAWDDGLEVWEGGKKIAASPGWSGLEGAVACDAKAQKLASDAEAQGTLSRATSVLGFGLGLGSLVTLGVAAGDHENGGTWLAVGASSAVVGLIFAIVTRSARTEADGRAVDALNFYGDARRNPKSACYAAESDQPDAPATRRPAPPTERDRPPPEEGERTRDRPVRAPDPPQLTP